MLVRCLPTPLMLCPIPVFRLISQLLHFGGTAHSNVGKKVDECQPLLGIFGNSRTRFNNNSSRFGKFIEIVYDGPAIGYARVKHYLLEKSRVVEQPRSEQNFHIFHCLLAGMSPEMRGRHGLTDGNSSYGYINADLGDNRTSDAELTELYAELRSSQATVGLTEDERFEIDAAVLFVLLLGNVGLGAAADNPDASQVLKPTTLVACASKLKANPAVLEDVLIHRRMIVRGEESITPNTSAQAVEVRDSIAKATYEALFHWLVAKVNRLLAPKKALDRSLDSCELGILDLFGFENFDSNGFEQFCINAANEKLQDFFNTFVFQWELEEYKREGVTAPDIEPLTNAEQIAVIFGNGGVLSVLNDEARMAKATDETFLLKLTRNLKSSAAFRTDAKRQDAFGVNHFAGEVWYSTSRFIEKNRNKLPGRALHELFGGTEIKTLQEIMLPFQQQFAVKTSSGDEAAPSRAKRFKERARNLLSRRGKSQKGAAGGVTNKAQTIATGFKNNLLMLLHLVKASQPHFVRCVRPNNTKQPGFVHDKQLTTQLKNAGVLETIAIRQRGYSVRLTFAEFLEQFGALLLVYPSSSNSRRASLPKATPELCTSMLQSIDGGTAAWKIGKNKVFLKYAHMQQLLQRLATRSDHVIVLQKHYRGQLGRRRAKQRAVEVAEEIRQAAELERRKAAEKAAAEKAAVEKAQREHRQKQERDAAVATELKRAKAAEATAAEQARKQTGEKDSVTDKANATDTGTKAVADATATDASAVPATMPCAVAAGAAPPAAVHGEPAAKSAGVVSSCQKPAKAKAQPFKRLLTGFFGKKNGAKKMAAMFEQDGAAKAPRRKKRGRHQKALIHTNSILKKDEADVVPEASAPATPVVNPAAALALEEDGVVVVSPGSLRRDRLQTEWTRPAVEGVPNPAGTQMAPGEPPEAYPQATLQRPGKACEPETAYPTLSRPADIGAKPLEEKVPVVAGPATIELTDFCLQSYNDLEQKMTTLDEIPPGTRPLNRYKNILPNPKTRVDLTKVGDRETSTFINANYIHGFDGENTKAYIAAQGPLSNDTVTTVDDFWRMVWEQDVRTVVMVTKEIESGKPKCARYWPRALWNPTDQVGDAQHGDINVRIMSGYRREGYITSKLSVRHRGENKVREIWHFWYDRWPDHGVPRRASPVAAMLKGCAAWDSSGKPWVVHCSAGIGRTGTFIAIDIGMRMVERALEEKTALTLDVFDIVDRIRDDRGGMVQHPEQAQFVHEALATVVAEATATFPGAD